MLIWFLKLNPSLTKWFIHNLQLWSSSLVLFLFLKHTWQFFILTFCFVLGVGAVRFCVVCGQRTYSSYCAGKLELYWSRNLNAWEWLLWTINPKPSGNRNEEQFSAFRLSVVRSKPKQLQQPIIARKISPGNQWEWKWNKQTSWSAGKTRESQGTIGFSFKFDWLRRRRELFEPIIEQS